MAIGPANSLVELRIRAGDIQLSSGRTAFIAEPDGVVRGNPHHGLFVYQTRVLGQYRWLMNGKEPEISVGSNIEQHSWMGYFIQAPQDWKGTAPAEASALQQTIELRLKRFVGEGMLEEVQLTNHTQVAARVRLELQFEPQFISPEEAVHKRNQFGKLVSSWRAAGAGVWELDLSYEAEHDYEHQGITGHARLRRGLRLRIEHACCEPDHSERHIRFDVALGPHKVWQCCLSWLARIEDRELPLSAKCQQVQTAEIECRRSSYLSRATQFGFGEGDLRGVVHKATERARLDLAALRLFDLERDGEVAMAAGVPTYMAVFGRDMLGAAWQAAVLGPELALGSLDVLSRSQASEENAWRDAEPGKIVHEMHTDPLAVLNFNPRSAYYGSVSGSFLYPLLLSELWHWTGELDVVRPFIGPAQRALQCADRYSLDETGFYRYQTKSEQGMKNQGWKDSEDAIVHPDGSEAQTPIGTCEMQAFAYAAKRHFSEILWWVGEHSEASRLYQDASDLKERFNERFWMEESGTYAMGIDKHGELIRSVASDAGHCLLSGIVAEERVERLANRMLMKDMFSGWGIRTLSADHAAYNPFSYHRGSIWPVENGSFVLGFARYGLHGEMHRLARALFEAAELFPHLRLPEVFGGHERSQDSPFPGLYNRANWPQAWSAASVLTVLRALLGLFPYAVANLLVIDPHLPDWLPDVTVENLRVGKARTTIYFFRQNDGRTDYRIVDLEGKLHIVRHPSPNSLTTDWAERIKDTLFSLLPGH